MSLISNVFGYLLNWLYNFCGNYGLAIIIFSVLLRLILMPITIKQQRTMKKSAEMQDKLKEIQFKYKNDPQKLNQETIELYKKEKMSPFSGCLSVILQLIIFVSVFYLVSRPLTYMKKMDTSVIEGYVNEVKTEENSASKYYEIEVIQKKSSEHPDVYINMNFLGLDLSKVPNQNVTDITVYIIPALYVITSFFSIKMTNNIQTKKKNKTENVDAKENTEQEETLESMQEMNKSMMYMMPIMSIFIAFITPLGLALYWLISNLLMMLERFIVDKTEEHKESQELN